MSQHSPGGKQALDYLIADLNDIIEMAYNPGAVEALALKCIRRVNNDIDPKMRRAEPTLEQRIRELEERLERVENRVVIVKEPIETPRGA